MTVTLAHILGSNATVYTPNRKPTGYRDTRSSRKVDGRSNGRRSGGIDIGRGFRQGGINNNTNKGSSQHNTAAPHPQQYAQVMVIPLPLYPGTLMSPHIAPPSMGYPQPYPYTYRFMGWERS